MVNENDVASVSDFRKNMFISMLIAIFPYSLPDDIMAEIRSVLDKNNCDYEQRER